MNIDSFFDVFPDPIRQASVNTRPATPTVLFEEIKVTYTECDAK